MSNRSPIDGELPGTYGSLLAVGSGRLSRLRGDFQKIQENFRVLGRHLNNAAGSYSETDKTMTKLDAKLSQIEQPVLQTETTEAPTLPL